MSVTQSRQIVVLGSGMVGSAIAADLAREPSYAVTAVDASATALEHLAARAPVRTVRPDLSQSAAVAALVAGCDLVVSAVPGHMGFATLRQVIDAGANVVDISFFAEAPPRGRSPGGAFALDDLARERRVTAVVDCGVAPGLCNILAGHVYSLLERTERYVCYVGGLPQVRTWPYEYKAVFSPADVIEEYTRPARLVEHGQVVVRPALSEVELCDFAGVGTLEAFNTDGLRSLIRTLDIPNMAEKTLRYPGHADLMRTFRESGFFDTQPVQIGEAWVRPLDLTSHLLFEQWRREPGEADLTVMQVVIEGLARGTRGEVRQRYTYDLLDRYDPETQTTSMARTTGYTCAIVARQVINGLFRRVGICPPEYVGQQPECYADLLKGYAQRGIHLQETIAVVETHLQETIAVVET